MDEYEYRRMLDFIEGADFSDYEQQISLLTDSMIPFVHLMMTLKRKGKTKYDYEMWKKILAGSLTSSLLMMGNNVDEALTIIGEIKKIVVNFDNKINTMDKSQ